MEICKSNTPKSLNEFLQPAKLSRFKNSFNNFFENLSFSRVDNSSTDEKRILFKNSNSINGGIVLIDEPELSMHPIWQKRFCPIIAIFSSPKQNR